VNPHFAMANNPLRPDKFALLMEDIKKLNMMFNKTLACV
jgi:hypothetical protein